MSWLRYKLGVWLLQPWLFAEAQHARVEGESDEEGLPPDPCWNGRFQAVSDLLFGKTFGRLAASQESER